MDTLHQLREYLKARLKQEGFTLSQFALESGISQGGLSMILNRQRGVSIKILERIASTFRLKTWELLKEASELEKATTQKESKGD